METQNEKKARLLGEPFGTANGKLRKMLLFSLAQKLGMDLCYRCKQPISTLSEFTIEHHKSWMNAADPKEAFYDLSQISFSHLHCNVAAGSHPHKKYESRKEKDAEASRRRYADPVRYAGHLSNKRSYYRRDNPRSTSSTG